MFGYANNFTFWGIDVISRRFYQPLYFADAIWQRTKVCKELSEVTNLGHLVVSKVRKP